MEMRDFTSKELQRTFDTIYFVGQISKASSPSPHTAIFTNRASYANKTVLVKGKIVKLNLAIMGKNWVHLRDGTGDEGTNDLVITTNDQATLGEIATFEGTITLDKDFGSGYVYEVIMEQAKILHD